MVNKIASFRCFIASRPSVQLALIAGMSVLIYGLAFTLPFPLARFYATVPPVDYVKLTNRSPVGLVVYVAGIAALFCLFLRAVRLAVSVGRRSVERGSVLSLSVFLGSGSLAVISIFSYPLSAIDLFIYAIRTRGWALYGLNPLATAPEMLPTADPWVGLAGQEWVGAASPYGSVWEVLSLGVFYLSGGDFLRHLFALKILAALAYMGCAWLVYRIVQQHNLAWAIAGTVAFAWNPLTLLESVQNGHNDIVMVFFLLMAVWALGRASGQQTCRRLPCSVARLLSCLFLALSVLVKFVTIITVPFFLLGMVRDQKSWLRRLGLLLWYGAVVAVLVVSGMLPLWPGWENWAVVQAGGKAGRSLLALLVFGLKDSLGVNPAFDLSLKVVLVLFGLIYLYWLGWFIIRFGRAALPVPTGLLPILGSFFILFWYVLLAAPVFHAWYLLWFLPLASLLLPYRRPFATAAVFSVTALFAIPYFETVRSWCPVLLEKQFTGHLIGVSLLIVPPVVAVVWPKIAPVGCLLRKKQRREEGR